MTGHRVPAVLVAIAALLSACLGRPASYRLAMPGDAPGAGNLRVSFAPPAYKARLFIDQAPVAELDERGGVDKILIRGLDSGRHSVEVRSTAHEERAGTTVLIASNQTTDVVLQGPMATSQGERIGGLILLGLSLAAGFAVLLIVVAGAG